MRVLIAVDEKKYGDALIDFVLKHSWPAETEFKIIHVVEPLMVASYMSIYPSPLLTEIIEENTKYGTKLVSILKDNLKAGLPNNHVYAEVFTEIPKYGILTQAKEWQADMIVMGSHGRSGLTRVLLGSVAEAVMSNAHCSVTIVRLAPESNTGTDKESDSKNVNDKVKAGVK